MQHCSFPSEQTQPQLLLIPAHLDPLSYFMTRRQRIKESEDGEVTHQSGEIGKKGGKCCNHELLWWLGKCAKVTFKEDDISHKAEEEPLPDVLILSWKLVYVCFSLFLMKKIHRSSAGFNSSAEINNSILSYANWESACKSEGIINTIAGKDILVQLLFNEHRTGSFYWKLFFGLPVDHKTV